MASERDMPDAAGERPAAASSSPTYPAYPAGSARAAQPPLTKRLRTGHWVAIDCVVAAFAALCDLVVVHNALLMNGRGGILAALLLVVATTTPIGLRRRAPGVSFGVLLVLAGLLSGLGPAVLGLILLAAAYVLYTVTVTASKRTGVTALALVIATIVIVAAARPHNGDGVGGILVPVALANIIAWGTGYSVRQRRLYIVRLQHQAASSAVAEERLRIARELHDVVAHSMSVIAVQAGYGQYVIDTSPDGARDALGAIQATSRDALEEMRRMLGVLRQQDVTPAPLPVVADLLSATPRPPAPAPLAPAPGLADIDRLIKRTGGAGIRVTLEVTGRVRSVPAGIDLSAYRIIQEALTNVVKHSGGNARCTVNLYYGIANLDVRVIDDGGPSPAGGGGTGPRAAFRAPLVGAGHGIVGMRERVNLCGGTFKVGPLAEGGFLVAATLPLPPVTDEQAAEDKAVEDRAAENKAADTADATSPPVAAAPAAAVAAGGQG